MAEKCMVGFHIERQVAGLTLAFLRRGVALTVIPFLEFVVTNYVNS